MYRLGASPRPFKSSSKGGKATVFMKCPRCGRELCEQILGGVSLDICNGGCGGVWFDNFELKRLLSADKAEQDQLKIDWDPSVRTESDRLKCPKCMDVTMQNHPYPGHWEINIDECARCGGVWLDRGEFEQIRNVARSDSPPAPSFSSQRREAPRTTGTYFSRKLHGRGVFTRTLDNMSGDPVGDLSDALETLPSKNSLGTVWGLGIILAGLLVQVGIRKCISTETYMYTRGGAVRLTGLLADSYGLMILFIGLLLHFHFFWGAKEDLQRYAIPAKMVSLGLFIISLFIFLWQCFRYMSGAL